MKKQLLTTAGICSAIAIVIFVILLNTIAVNTAYAKGNDEWILIGENVINLKTETDKIKPIALIKKDHNKLF
ncbi:hypothetical protein [Aliivibrio logei]|uniref:hypothetical protein n=1 Tax=Aliivibrio logei TaxID=688 RepID=UPI000399DFD3|nr:hypothetical protein [Aliivibrio logei]